MSPSGAWGGAGWAAHLPDPGPLSCVSLVGAWFRGCGLGPVIPRPRPCCSWLMWRFLREAAQSSTLGHVVPYLGTGVPFSSVRQPPSSILALFPNSFLDLTWGPPFQNPWEARKCQGFFASSLGPGSPCHNFNSSVPGGSGGEIVGRDTL